MSVKRRRSRRQNRLRRNMIIGSAALVVIAAAGTAVYWNLPNTKLGRKLAEASGYMEVQAFEEAKTAYEEALEIDATSELAYRGLADDYLAQDMQEEAEAILQDGYEKTGSEVLLQNYRATVLNDVVVAINGGTASLQTVGRCLDILEDVPDDADALGLLETLAGRVLLEDGSFNLLLEAYGTAAEEAAAAEDQESAAEADSDKSGAGAEAQANGDAESQTAAEEADADEDAESQNTAETADADADAEVQTAAETADEDAEAQTAAETTDADAQNVTETADVQAAAETTEAEAADSDEETQTAADAQNGEEETAVETETQTEEGGEPEAQTGAENADTDQINAEGKTKIDYEAVLQRLEALAQADSETYLEILESYLIPEADSFYLSLSNRDSYFGHLEKAEALGSDEAAELIDCLEKQAQISEYFAPMFVDFEEENYKAAKEFIVTDEYKAIRDAFIDGTMEYWKANSYVSVTKEALELERTEEGWLFSFVEDDTIAEPTGTIRVLAVKMIDLGVQRSSIEYVPAYDPTAYYPHTEYEIVYWNTMVSGIATDNTNVVSRMNYRFAEKIFSETGMKANMIYDWGGANESRKTE